MALHCSESKSSGRFFPEAKLDTIMELSPGATEQEQKDAIIASAEAIILQLQDVVKKLKVKD